MIRPGVPAPNLAPRIAAASFRERGGVAYRSLAARSLLNRCSSPRMPFEYTVNPYRGCAMGCHYCYAAYTHEFMGVETPEAFHTTVFVKAGGLDETARRLPGIIRSGARIALGTATDPYQPGEADLRVTRAFLELVAQHRNVRLGITTKGAVILRDLDLLARIHERSSLSISVSLVSPRAELLRRLEPWAPPPAVRLEMMRRLSEAGLRVALGLAPVLPALTDGEADLAELLGSVRKAGVTRMFANVLFLRSPTKEKYLRWLAAEFPQYLEAYRRAYADRAYLRGRYRLWIEERIGRLREKFGFQARDPARPTWGRPQAARQLRLWA
jgi:DNA repair photolyase